MLPRLSVSPVRIVWLQLASVKSEDPLVGGAFSIPGSDRLAATKEKSSSRALAVTSFSIPGSDRLAATVQGL